MNHQKFCRHRTRRPFGKTNRLSIIDGDEKTKGTPRVTSLHVEHAVADLLRERPRRVEGRAPRRLAREPQSDHS